MNHDTWRELIDYGRWAPSPHNIQPWKFRPVDDRTLIVFYDPSRLLPDTDPTGRFTAAGFGILFETLEVAAAARRLDIKVAYATDGSRLGSAATEPPRLDPRRQTLIPFARLTLVPRVRQPERFDRELIKTRSTSRLPYDDKPVAQHVLDDLAAIAESFGHTLEFSSDPEDVSWVVDLNAYTMFADMTDPLARNEVGGWIRYSKRDAMRRKDGLAAYAMGFQSVLMWLFVKCNWLFRLPVVYQITRALYTRSMKGTRTVAWLSGPFDEPNDWDRAGRMLARLWLCMTEHGVYLHPFGSVITNKSSNARMTEHFANESRQWPLWLLVRLGHSDEPPRAQRLSVDDLMLPPLGRPVARRCHDGRQRLGLTEN